MFYGTVLAVDTTVLATSLVGGHSVGVTQLRIADGDQFPEFGAVLLGADKIGYTAISRPTEDVTDQSSYLLLTTPTVNAYGDAQQVTMPDIVTKRALVRSQKRDRPQWAAVPFAAFAQLPEGTRTRDHGERVSLASDTDSQLHVVNVVSEAPSLDASLVDPDHPITPEAVTKSLDQYPDQYANRISAEAIKAGSMTADIVLAGEIRAGGGPGEGAVVMNAQGIYTTAGDGQPRTSLPNDPTQPDIFRGVVDADRVSVKQGIFLNGDSYLGSGSTLTMLSGIGPPTIPPSAVTTWPTITVAFGPNRPPNEREGLAIKSLTEAYSIGTKRLLVFNPTTGALLANPTFDIAGRLIGVGYSSVADRIRTLEYTQSIGEYIVRSYSYAAGVLAPDPGGLSFSVASVLHADGGEPTIAVAKQGAVDTLYLGQSQADGKVIIWTFVNGVLTATNTSATALTTGAQVLVGMAIVGLSVHLSYATGWTSPTGEPSVPVISIGSNPAPYIGKLRTANGDTTPCGTAHLDGDTLSTRTWYLSGVSNMLVQHSSPLEYGTYWAQAAWRDSATGKESKPGPAVQVFKIPGSTIVLGMGELPTGVDSVDLFLGAGTPGQPPNSDMWSQGFTATGTLAVFSVVKTGTNPKTVADLVGGTPSMLRSDDLTVALRGDKTGWLVDAINAAAARQVASKVTGTTDASANITFTHTLGVVPTAWQAWTADYAAATALSYFVPVSATATTVTFIVRGSGAALQPSKAVTAHMVVYR